MNGRTADAITRIRRLRECMHAGTARTATLLMLLAGCHEGAPQGAMTPPATVEGGDPAIGAQLIDAYGCGTCHTIPGIAAARGMVGPPLTDWSRRVYIAGTLRNRPEELIRWISNPQEIEPGTAMPSLGVSQEEARHIAAYLYTIGNPIDLGPPHLLPEAWLHALGSTESPNRTGGR